MQKWEEIEQKKEYLKGYINSKNREALIKDQIQQLRLDTMFPALQGDGMPRGSSQKDLSDYTAKIESLTDELKKEWIESVIQYERIRKLLKQLGEKDRVFSLEWNEENITLMECCDYCFGHDLTKEECKELSEVFRELAEELGK